MNIKAQMLSYAGVNIINAAVPFLLLPILTAYLSPSDYGLLSLIQLLMIVSLPIVLMNTQGLLIIEYSKFSFEKFQTLFSLIVLISIIGFIFLELLFFLFKSYIIDFFHIPGNYIYIIPFFVFLQVIPTIIPILFQAMKNPVSFGKYKLSLTITNVLLSLLFVIIFTWGWEGRLLGIVVAFFVFFMIGIVLIYRMDLFKFTLDKELLKTVLAYGLPLVPHSIAGTFLLMSDRVFLANMLGDNAVGIYSVAFQIASAVSIIMLSVNQAWSPNLYEQLNNNPTMEEKKNIVLQTYKIMGGMMFITIMFIIISPLLFDIFIDKTYQEGKDLTVVIAIAFMFQGFYYLIANYILYSKKTYILSSITLSSVLIVFILDYFCIKNFGIIGAAYAMLLVWITFFFVTWTVANKIYKMPWRLK